MIEESLKSELLQKVEDYLKVIVPYWTVEFLDGSNEFLMHTHSTEESTNPDELCIIIEKDGGFRVFKLVLFSVRIGDGELVFLYHLFCQA